VKQHWGNVRNSIYIWVSCVCPSLQCPLGARLFHFFNASKGLRALGRRRLLAVKNHVMITISTM